MTFFFCEFLSVLYFDKFNLMATILETGRLRLREFAFSDAQDIFLLNSDPEVVRYTGDFPFEDVKAAETFLKSYADYQKNGFGRWAVIDKNSGDFLGWCGLKFTADKSETDIGFRFFKRHWNKGYASESAKACLEYGFKSLGLTTIIGRAMADNKASVNVLEKIGMSFEKPFDFDGHAGVIYKIDTL
jgi:ribosomal-protein-alanine N-acetyltransferase